MNDKIKENLDIKLVIQISIYILIIGIIYATFKGDISRNQQDIKAVKKEVNMIEHNISVIKGDVREIKTILKLMQDEN